MGPARVSTPREPSTPRIAVWRKLRQLGAVQLVDSLVALRDRPNREQIDWVADEVVTPPVKRGPGRPYRGQGSAEDARLSDSTGRAEEYAAVLATAELGATASRRRRRTLKRLRREIRRIRDGTTSGPSVRAAEAASPRSRPLN